MTNNIKTGLDITKAAVKLAYANGMTLPTLYTMLQAEKQHQFRDDMTEFYIAAITEAIALLENPAFN